VKPQTAYKKTALVASKYPIDPADIVCCTKIQQRRGRLIAHLRRNGIE